MSHLKNKIEKIFEMQNINNEYKHLFGKTFENYLKDIQEDLFNINELYTNKELCDYVCVLAKNYKINESYSELNENFFDKLKQRYDKAKDVVSNLSDNAKTALNTLVSKAKDILSFITEIKNIIIKYFKDISTNTVNKIKDKLLKDVNFVNKTKELFNAEKNEFINDLKTAKNVTLFYKDKFLNILLEKIDKVLKDLLNKEDLPVSESLLLNEGNDNVISKLLSNISHIPPFSWLHDVAHAGEKGATFIINKLSTLTANLGGESFELPIIATLLGIAFEYNIKGLIKGGLLNVVATYSIPFIGVIVTVLGIMATFLATISVIDNIANTNIIASGH